MNKNNNIDCHHNNCRPDTSCRHPHGPMHGHKHGTANGFARGPMHCHAHRPMNGFGHGPMNPMFHPFFHETPSPEFLFFRADVCGTETGYLLEAELPGFKKEEISIEITGRALTVTAKKAVTGEPEEKGCYLHKERRTGTFRRTFPLIGIRTEEITASYEDGILRVALPKKERPTPEKRTVAVN